MQKKNSDKNKDVLLEISFTPMKLNAFLELHVELDSFQRLSHNFRVVNTENFEN